LTKTLASDAVGLVAGSFIASSRTTSSTLQSNGRRKTLSVYIFSVVRSMHKIGSYVSDSVIYKLQS
jgi:hypothetical protein